MGQKLEESVAATLGTTEGARETLEIAEEARSGPSEKASFGDALFLGHFASEMLIPFPEQSEEDRRIGDAYIAKLEPFLKEHLDPDQVEIDKEIPQKVIDGLKEMGAFAMKIPKEYQGLGFSQTNYNRVVMKVASYCGSTAVLLSAHQSIGVPQPLRYYGTEAQKQQFLPRFRQGAISAFALTEPNAGSDPAQMESEAKLSEDGSHYILNGEKLWCTNGTVADIIIVIAKTAPKIVKGREKTQMSAFVLEMNTPGIEVTQRCEFMGLGGIYNGFLRFTDVKIPAENLVGEEGRGLAIALGTINVGRLTLPAASTGVAKQCLMIARKWGNERVQWGQPIGLHETGRLKIATIAAQTFAMEAMTWLTSAWEDQGDIDIRVEAAMAKLFSTEALWKITDLTMQLRGGRGYEKARSLKARGEPGYPVERMMRDCRINMILEGTSEIMRLFLAREAIDPHLKLAIPLLKGDFSFKNITKVLKFYITWYPKQLFGRFWKPSYREFGPLAKHARFIDTHSHRLARTLFNKMARYQKKLENKQLILGRLMEVATELFAMSASLSYAISLGTPEAFDLADHFCTLSRRRINSRLSSLSDNDDHSTNAIAKRVLDGDMEWLESGVIPF